MVVTLARIDDVNRFVAAVEAVLDERQQHAILLVLRVEERAHVPRAIERLSGEGDVSGLGHLSLAILAERHSMKG